jgi:transposase-like protein
MGAKQSQEMRDAIALTRTMTVKDAAETAGVNRTALHDALRKIRQEKESQKGENSPCNVGLNDIE